LTREDDHPAGVEPDGQDEEREQRERVDVVQVGEQGQNLGFTAGPVTFGALVDRTDSYTVGWAVVIGLCLLALVLTRAWRRHTG
jgi:hypothetical protein